MVLRTARYLVRADGLIQRFEGNGVRIREHENKSLYAVVTPAARPLVEAVHRRVLKTGEPLVLPYRCDDQTHANEFTLSLFPAKQHMLYQSELVSRTPQLFVPPNMAEPVHYSLCAWCKETGRGPADAIWRPVEQVAAYLPASLAVTHGICPPCSNTVDVL